jgi:hypothetical protein
LQCCRSIVCWMMKKILTSMIRCSSHYHHHLHHDLQCSTLPTCFVKTNSTMTRQKPPLFLPLLHPSIPAESLVSHLRLSTLVKTAQSTLDIALTRSPACHLRH